MKKRLWLLLLIFAVLSAGMLQILTSALASSNYSSSKEPLIVDSWKGNSGNPNDTDNRLTLPEGNPITFYDYKGDWEVGSFPKADPAAYSTFHGYNYTYDIVCQNAGVGGAGDEWTYGGMYVNSSGLFLADGYATALAYTAPKSGTVRLSVPQFRINTGAAGSVGVDFAIFKNGEMIWPTSGNWQSYVPASAATGSNQNFYFTPSLGNLTAEVLAGDRLTFAFCRQTNPTRWIYDLNPTVTYTSYHGESFSQTEGFTAVQGGGNWHAYYAPSGRTSAYPLPYDAATGRFGGIEGAGTVSAGSLTVGSEYDTVLLFRSPLIATYKLVADGAVANKSVAYQVTAYNYTASGVTTTDYGSGTVGTAASDFEKTGIYLDRGDIVAIRFKAVDGGASVSFAPVAVTTDTIYATSQNGEVFTSVGGEKLLMPDVRLSTASLLFTEQLNINFYAIFSSDMTAGGDFGLLVSKTADGCTYADAEKLSGTRLSDGSYKFTYTDIAAKEMCDVLYVRAYAKTGNGVALDILHEVSVRSLAMKYYDAYKGSSTVTGKALYEFVCGMMNYGAAAQSFFSYNTADLANKELTAAEKTVPAGSFTDATDLTGIGNVSMVIKAANLVLNDLPSIRIYADNTTGGPLTVECATDAAFTQNKVTYVLSADQTTYVSGATYQYIDTVGIGRANWDTVYYFRLTDGEGYSQTLAYSVESYAARMYTGTGSKLDAVLDSMFNFADKADAYAAAARIPADTDFALGSLDLADAIRNGTVQAGKTYTVTDLGLISFLPNDSGMVLDCKNITVYAESGFSLRGLSDVTLKNLNLELRNTGAIGVELTATSNVQLENVTIGGYANTGVQAGASTKDLFLRDVSVVGNTVANGLVATEGSTGVYLLDSTLRATTAIKDQSVGGIYAEGNTLAGNVAIYANGTELRTTTMESGDITVRGDNVLVANTVAPSSKLNAYEVFNNVFVKNDLYWISVSESKNIYVVENTIRNILALENIDYLLADDNGTYVNGSAQQALDFLQPGERAPFVLQASGNTNQNGDSLMDVDARLAVGADEDLLPHVNKDLFVGMPRKTTVRTADGSMGVSSYMTTTLESGSEVILAPGAYQIDLTLNINSLSNKTIYGYGALLERPTSAAKNNLSTMVYLQGSHNIDVLGLSLGYAEQATGQVHILEKLPNNQLRVVTGAGMMNEFGKTNTNFYNTDTIYLHRVSDGQSYAWCEDKFTALSKNGDGTMTMTVPANLYNIVDKGDVFTCRAATGGQSFSVNGSSGVNLRDLTMYGSSGGFAFVEHDNTSATTYYRIYNTSRSASLLTADEYNRYTALESQYGVDLDIYVDEEGRYRGGTPLLGSIDATHTSRCTEGSQATSCLFENMSDDGTNQRHNPSRLHAYEYSADGKTITLTYKDSWSHNRYRLGQGGHNSCLTHHAGDRILIYTHAGQLVCDTTVKSVIGHIGTGTNQAIIDAAARGEITISSEQATKYNMYKVVIDAKDASGNDIFNVNALAGYNLLDDNYVDEGKVFVDNMNYASAFFHFDNVVVQNIRSRGLLLKSSNATVENCTLRNIGMGAIAVHYESVWGESGISENMTIRNNLIENTGYFVNIPGRGGMQHTYAPISVLGLGSSSDPDYLLNKNLVIEGNVIRNRWTDSALYINSSNGVTIRNNDFGDHVNASSLTAPHPSIHVFCANNVHISGNIYPANATTPTTKMLLEFAGTVTGSDATGATVISGAVSFADNLPDTSGNTPVYKGGWQLGGSTIGGDGKISSFSLYDAFYNEKRFFYESSSNNMWVTGGFGTSSREFAFCQGTNAGSTPTIRFTAQQAGSYTLDFSKFAAPTAEGSNGAFDGYFAIFKNGEMVWPTNGEWFVVTAETTSTDMRSALAGATVELEVGDTLSFCSQAKESVNGLSWSKFVFLPRLSYGETVEYEPEKNCSCSDPECMHMIDYFG